MKLTIQIQLVPDESQRERLLETMKRSNEAASFAARTGFAAGVFTQPAIHKLAYAEIRARFGLSAQMAVRAIGKAVECFARDKTRCPAFRPHGAVTYDERIFRFMGLDRISLWALPTGRVVVPIVFGEYQRERFDRIKGQANLVYRNRRFYLYCTVDVPKAAPVEPADFLGIDLGVTNIATDSDGRRYSGTTVKSVRYRHRRLRQRLQRKHTTSANRRLKKLSGKEERFAQHVNHVVSKQIVADAKRTGLGIALEDLKHIQRRVTARRRQRVVLHNWAFAQLRKFVEYKAALSGVAVAIVDPKNSSRECSHCHHVSKANRPNQSTFRCRACGHTCHADFNAAENLRARGRAAVNPPYAAVGS